MNCSYSWWQTPEVPLQGAHNCTESLSRFYQKKLYSENGYDIHSKKDTHFCIYRSSRYLGQWEFKDTLYRVYSYRTWCLQHNLYSFISFSFTLTEREHLQCSTAHSKKVDSTHGIITFRVLLCNLFFFFRKLNFYETENRFSKPTNYLFIHNLGQNKQHENFKIYVFLRI